MSLRSILASEGLSPKDAGTSPQRVGAARGSLKLNQQLQATLDDYWTDVRKLLDGLLKNNGLEAAYRDTSTPVWSTIKTKTGSFGLFVQPVFGSYTVYAWSIDSKTGPPHNSSGKFDLSSYYPDAAARHLMGFVEAAVKATS